MKMYIVFAMLFVSFVLFSGVSGCATGANAFLKGYNNAQGRYYNDPEPVSVPAHQSTVCSSCGGTGNSMLNCIACDGTGRVSGLRCYMCKGKGFGKCGICGGTGKE